MSLGIAFIYNGEAYLASDRRHTILNNDGSHAAHRDENKMNKLQWTYYTVLGIDPLITQVKNRISNLSHFNISQIEQICKEEEAFFKASLNDELKKAQWLQNGTVELLAIIWADDTPCIGVMSSDNKYLPEKYYEEGRVLGKSAVNPETMLSVVLKHFNKGHSTIKGVLGHIFRETNKISPTISKEFDFANTRKKINKLAVNQITAGNFDAINGMKLGTNTSTNKVFRFATEDGKDACIQAWTGPGGPILTFGYRDSSDSDSSAIKELESVLIYSTKMEAASSTGIAMEGTWNFSNATVTGLSPYVAGNGIDIDNGAINIDPSEVAGYGIIEDINQRFAIDKGTVVTNETTGQEVSLNVYNAGSNYVLEVYVDGGFVGEVALNT